jgi:hypothetical protein
MSTKEDASGIASDLQNIIQGAQTVLTGKTISFRGTTMTQAQVVQAAQAQLAPYSAVSTDRTKLKQDVQTRSTSGPVAKQWVADFKLSAGSTFGVTSVEYSQFGFKPNKTPTPLTADEKQLKTARNRATRLVRNTMGKKQKQAVKGQVPAPQSSASSPVPSPGTGGTPATPVQGATPAPPTTPAGGNGATTGSSK